MNLSRVEEAALSCVCRDAGAADGPPRNPPGLPALRYRVGVHATFLRRMLHALSLHKIREPKGETGSPPVPAYREKRPLAGLTARTPDDPAIAFLDACATVADVLTFYQERIANEGYLGTATERRSVLQLARAIGYELSPGVAAQAYLAFTVEDAKGAPGISLLEKGMQVQSVPPQGKSPQVFETSAEFTARAEWNLLRPRLTRPAELAVLGDGADLRLCLIGPSETFPLDTDGLVRHVEQQNLHRLDAAEAAGTSVDAVDVKRVWFADDAAPALAKGNLLLFAGKNDGQTKTLVLRIAGLAPDPDNKRIGVDLEPLPRPTAPQAEPRGLTKMPYLSRLAGAFASVRLARMQFNRANLESTVLFRTWRERDLQALIGIQGWRRTSLARAANTKPAEPPVSLESGAFAFREKLGFFGHNAPKWKSVPNSSPPLRDDPYPQGWDKGDSPPSGPALPRSRLIWTDSQGVANTDAGGPHVFLERPVQGLVRKSWILVTSPDQEPEVYGVGDAREMSRADYGLNGRAMGVRLLDRGGNPIPDNPTEPPFQFRTASANVASERLKLAELPIESPVGPGATSIELDRMVLGLQAGQPIVLSGELHDTAGVENSEIAFLSDIVHEGGRTTLVLRDGLERGYVRDKLRINANVVHATHGETVRELLGGGDAAIANQRFALKKPPLTYVSVPTPRGSKSTLELRVNGVLWQEVPSLFELEPEDEGYVVRLDDAGRVAVTFGDGARGARLPTGAANVTAQYRSGIGPDGEVEAGSLTLLLTRPLGLREVTNPVDAGGAEGPERLDQARQNAPLTVLTFDRVVSLRDYEDFARTFPGIGKAQADALWLRGRRVLHLTVTTATGKVPSSDLLAKLSTAIEAASDLSQHVVVQAFAQRYFTCAARILVDRRFVAADVLAAAEQRIKDAFSFDARSLGQPVIPEEVSALLHEVAGVVAVDLDSLLPYTEDGSAAGAAAAGRPAAIPASRAYVNEQTGAIEPAELLLVNPVGIDLSLMT
jgi:hypothetical protein